MPEFNYVDVVRLGLNAANARVPRLQPSAIKEFGEMLSREVTAGEWQIDGDAAINSKGQNVEEFLNHLISTRPHWEVPATVVDKSDEVWLSGSLTQQGKRWKAIYDVLGNKAATDEAMKNEAALYGVVPGSTKPGVKPGTKVDPDPAARNPYNPCARGGDEEARMKKILSLVSSSAKLAASLARSANPPCDIAGRPLPKK